VASSLKVYSARALDALAPLAAEDFQPIDYAAVQSAMPPSAGIDFLQLMDGDGSVVVKSASLGDNEMQVGQQVIDAGAERRLGVRSPDR
jgi:hypothetical protein